MNLNEQFDLLMEKITSREERMWDAIFSMIQKKLAAGKPLSTAVSEIDREVNTNVSAREIEKRYIDKFGDPHARKINTTVRNNVMRKFGFRVEEGGAGEWGTKKLTKKYRKDTPGEDLNEAEEDSIDAKQMKAFEAFVDKMFKKYDIDFDFTKHFAERMNDKRNTPRISLKELATFIKKIYARQGKSLKQEKNAEAVIKDMQSELNIPVVIKYDQKNDEFDVVMKTIMRKKNFSTPNKTIKY